MDLRNGTIKSKASCLNWFFPLHPQPVLQTLFPALSSLVAETAWTGLKWLALNCALCTLKRQLLLRAPPAAPFGGPHAGSPKVRNAKACPVFAGTAKSSHTAEPHSGVWGQCLFLANVNGAPRSYVGGAVFGASLRPERRGCSCGFCLGSDSFPSAAWWRWSERERASSSTRCKSYMSPVPSVGPGKWTLGWCLFYEDLSGLSGSKAQGQKEMGKERGLQDSVTL